MARLQVQLFNLFESTLQGQGSSAVVVVEQGGSLEANQEGWLAAGLASGQAALVDARSGGLCSFWQAHDGGLSALAAAGEHMLLTAGSQVCDALLQALIRRRQ